MMNKFTMPNPPDWSEALLEGLSPVFMALIDDSHLHSGRVFQESFDHTTHLRLCIISESFEGKTRLERHQLVLLFLHDIPWSLSIKALSLKEATERAPDFALCPSFPSCFAWKRLNHPKMGSGLYCYPKESLEDPIEGVLGLMQSAMMCAKKKA